MLLTYPLDGSAPYVERDGFIAYVHLKDDPFPHTDWLEQPSFAGRLEEYQADRWHFIGIAARAFRCGVALGDASLWGIESDSDADYIDATAFDVAIDAIAQAKAKLSKLIESVQEES